MLLPTFALLSLMCFQASRFDSRMGDDNTIILLEHQDRRQWDQDLIRRGTTILTFRLQDTVVRLSYRICHCG